MERNQVMHVYREQRSNNWKCWQWKRKWSKLPVYQSTHSTLPTLVEHRCRMDEHTCMGLNIRLEQVMLITHFFLFMTMFHVQCVTLQHENDSTNNCCISQMVQCKPNILVRIKKLLVCTIGRYSDSFSVLSSPSRSWYVLTFCLCKINHGLLGDFTWVQVSSMLPNLFEVLYSGPIEKFCMNSEVSYCLVVT